MKHRSNKKILSRKKSARIALIKQLACSLIFYENIKTTEAKAKALRPIVEKLISRGKINNLTTRRQLLNYLKNEKAVKKILEVLSPRYQTKKGGYLKIIKMPKTKINSVKIAIVKFC